RELRRVDLEPYPEAETPAPHRAEVTVGRDGRPVHNLLAAVGARDAAHRVREAGGVTGREELLRVRPLATWAAHLRRHREREVQLSVGRSRAAVATCVRCGRDRRVERLHASISTPRRALRTGGADRQGVAWADARAAHRRAGGGRRTGRGRGGACGGGARSG